MTEVVSKVICKNCGSEAVVKFGSYKGVQRYWCKVCKRKFKADNALFDMKVSPEYISTALSMYYSGSSISDIRNQLKQEYGYYQGTLWVHLSLFWGQIKTLLSVQARVP